MLPASLAPILSKPGLGTKALRKAEQGATTPRGKIITDEQGKPLRLETGEAASQALGFRPERIARIAGEHRTALNLRRIRSTPEGGTWRDWPKELILDCHKRETGRSYGSIYGRMKWNGLAPTITTEFHGIGSGRFGHPEQDRAISLREGALLQTFPRSYKFVEKGHEFTIETVARHIGNAIPFRLGQAIVGVLTTRS